jgi:hypothetical protein
MRGVSKPRRPRRRGLGARRPADAAPVPVVVGRRRARALRLLAQPARRLRPARRVLPVARRGRPPLALPRGRAALLSRPHAPGRARDARRLEGRGDRGGARAHGVHRLGARLQRLVRGGPGVRGAARAVEGRGARVEPARRGGGRGADGGARGGRGQGRAARAERSAAHGRGARRGRGRAGARGAAPVDRGAEGAGGPGRRRARGAAPGRGAAARRAAAGGARAAGGQALRGGPGERQGGAAGADRRDAGGRDGQPPADRGRGRPLRARRGVHVSRRRRRRARVGARRDRRARRRARGEAAPVGARSGGRARRPQGAAGRSRAAEARAARARDAGAAGEGQFLSFHERAGRRRARPRRGGLSRHARLLPSRQRSQQAGLRRPQAPAARRGGAALRRRRGVRDVPRGRSRRVEGHPARGGVRDALAPVQRIQPRMRVVPRDGVRAAGRQHRDRERRAQGRAVRELPRPRRLARRRPLEEGAHRRAGRPARVRFGLPPPAPRRGLRPGRQHAQGAGPGPRQPRQLAAEARPSVSPRRGRARPAGRRECGARGRAARSLRRRRIARRGRGSGAPAGTRSRARARPSPT